MQNYGWFKENSGEVIMEAGLMLPNGFGIYDVMGNALEFVLDKYGDATIYSYGEHVTDPAGPIADSKNYRTRRGGASNIDCGSPYSRAYYRCPYSDGTYGNQYDGHRIVCPVTPNPGD